ncbi:RNA-binding S4 domain-containing protein [Leifsonia sp. NPDC058292]|uniref:RNA-binding S4 domain-containing protein n=1 Tax=Leifsonia sp. NPDC058292 TaxID=3346428 RepID=UPI0036DD05A6
MTSPSQSKHPNDAPTDVPIGGDAIRLGQFLKLAGLLDSGGIVKQVIVDGLVTVNGEVDLRRGRQLQLGDIVGFEGRKVRVSA